MGLSLKDVYNMRNGIIDFSKKLFSKTGNLSFSLNKNDVDDLYNNLDIKAEPTITKKENESKEDYKKRLAGQKGVMQNNKKNFVKGFNKLLGDTQLLTAQHTIGLDVYALLVEKHKELMDANKGKENDPVIVEFGKNINILKSQLLKNGVNNFEIDAKLKNDKNLNEKIKNGIGSIFADEVNELIEKNNVRVGYKNESIFKEKFRDVIDPSNVEKMDVQVSESNKTFYGMLKNAGFTFSRRFGVGYYEMPETIEKCPSGYKYNEVGEMVEKESKGFFSAISNFFGRLMNKGKVQQYNASLRQAKESTIDPEISKDVEYMERIDSEKLQIDLGKEFDKENEFTKDFEKELLAERKLMHEKELENTNEELFGPGLNQLD